MILDPSIEFWIWPRVFSQWSKLRKSPEDPRGILIRSLNQLSWLFLILKSSSFTTFVFWYGLYSDSDSDLDDFIHPQNVNQFGSFQISTHTHYIFSYTWLYMRLEQTNKKVKSFAVWLSYFLTKTNWSNALITADKATVCRLVFHFFLPPLWTRLPETCSPLLEAKSHLRLEGSVAHFINIKMISFHDDYVQGYKLSLQRVLKLQPSGMLIITVLIVFFNLF